MIPEWSRLRNLSVGSAGTVVYPPSAILPNRRLDDFEFIWIIEGASVAFYDAQRIAAPPGTLLLRRRGMSDRYEWAPEHRTVHAFVHFDFDGVPPGWPAIDRWPIVRLTSSDDILRPLFRFVLNLHNHAEPLRSNLILPALELMLRAFVSGRIHLASEPHAPLPPAVDRAMTFIQNTIFFQRPRAVSLAELAAAAHVTPEHLCRLFRRSLDLGPLECVRLARLQFAAGLLSRTAMSVKEVADAAGFANPYHFSRVFRQTYEVAPTEYQALIAAGQPVKTNPIVRNLRLDIADVVLGA